MTKSSQTEKAIRMAIIRLEKNKPKVNPPNTKLSFSAVAREAEVDRRTIDLYPKLRERIEGNMAKHKREDATTKQKALTKTRGELGEARKQIKRLNAYINELTSKNATMALKIQDLELKLSADNVTEISKAINK